MSSEPLPPSSAPVAGPNPFQRLVGVIFSPVATLRDIAERPEWLVAMILLILSSVGSYLVVAPKLDLETTIREQFEKRDITDPELVEKQVEMGLKVAKYTAPLSFIFVIIGTLIMAAVLLLAFKVMGGAGTFKQFLAITVYSWIPQILKSIAFCAVVATRGKMTQMEMLTLVKSNLGFLADPNTSAIPFAILSSIDIFNLWVVALLSIGLSFVSKMSRGKTAAIVVALWVVTILFKVGMAALQSAGGPS